jgi:hypothetical protein
LTIAFLDKVEEFRPLLAYESYSELLLRPILRILWL